MITAAEKRPTKKHYALYWNYILDRNYSNISVLSGNIRSNLIQKLTFIKFIPWLELAVASEIINEQLRDGTNVFV